MDSLRNLIALLLLASSAAALAQAVQLTEQERAQKGEKDARELQESLEKLVGAIGQYQQARQGRQQAPAQATGAAGAEGCERKGFAIVKTYSGGTGSDTAVWTAQSCGSVLYRDRGALIDIAYKNSCGCNIVMYVDNDGRADVHLRAHETTSFNNPRGRADLQRGHKLPKETGSCDKVGMGGDFPSYHAETNTCRLRPCSLNGTCTNTSSTAR